MSTKRTMWLFALGAVAVELAAWWTSLEPSRRRYLASVLKQVPHMPGRYAV